MSHILVGTVFALTLNLLCGVAFPRVAFAADPSVTLTLNNDSVGNNTLSPTANGTAVSAYYSRSVSVTVSNAGSYTVYAAYAHPDGGDNTALKGSVGGTSIANISTDVSNWGSDTSANMLNKWGFYYGDVALATTHTLHPIASSTAATTFQTPILTGTNLAGATTSDSIYIGMGATVNQSQAPGTYSGSIVLSVVAEAPAPSDLSGITTMQEMTPEICANTETPTAGGTHTTYTLTDTRDNKQYLVSKLADGRCWMVQNLALEGNTDSAKTITAYNAATGATFDYSLPQASTGTTSISPTFVSGTQLNMNNGTHINATQDSDYSTNTNTGSYYTWLVATAQTSSPSDTAGYDTTTSICPKGWRLPRGENSSLGNEYTTLYAAYSKNKSNLDAAWLPGYSGYINSAATTGSGYAYYWSGTVASSSNSYAAYNRSGTTSSYFTTTSSCSRYYGQSIRCIATTITGLSSQPTITYDANGGSGAPASATLSEYTSVVSTTIPTRSGYGFRGWTTTKYDPVANTDTTTLAEYLPGDGIATSSNITLYALWETNGTWPSTLTSSPQMQTMTTSICSSVTTPSKYNLTPPEITLTDSGTNRTDANGNTVSYRVRKLADGNCWMVDDLRLGLSTSKTLTSSDSNVASNWTPSSTDENTITDTSTTTSWASITDSARSIVNNSTDGDDSTKYGYLYNWYAATAETGTSSMSSGTASGSICPKGWQLPLGTTANKSFYNLIKTTYGLANNTAGSTALRSAPLQFRYSGSYGSGLSSQGSNGLYWSSSVSSSTSAYSLSFSFVSNNISPRSSYYKYNGGAVRCVAQ